ncbi:two-component sensor histidine kinase [Sphaerisporangium melleum]|uniref:histidine kinase n=1 Tax=Sphaerisporangium melleum TaxID=321316 RepID=A0A917RHH0_9ACTN|nr:HAMP domain-containing sensor histidine kinase [Sphaerisporangium melleum]GGL08081.1 two-component sensor histidine kinase [Sphaerisporangium melleum]GII74305.1 two-component sensor histidine kinase [Sphaerisporangium melleum]
MKRRLTLYAGVVAAVLCALVAGVVLFATQRTATAYLTKEIMGTAGRVATEVDRGNILDPIPHGLIYDIQVIDPYGKIVAASSEIKDRPPMADLHLADGRSTSTSTVCGGPAFPAGRCSIVAGQQVFLGGRVWTVYAAAPVVPPLVHPILAIAVIGGALLLTGCITYGTHRAVSASLASVEAIRTELDEINACCPGRRVPTPDTDDEIHDLAESVNLTLGRLQAAMEQQRRLASDASHDLRSPIAAIRAEVEDALMDPGEHDWKATGQAILSGLDRLQAIVSDLLTLARLDAGTPGASDRVDLAELVKTEMDQRARAKRVVLLLDPGAEVVADRVRLARLVTNLVDNAERHAESTITIKVYRVADGRDAHPEGAAVLEVLDDGAGIAPDKREVVFQRFTRLDAARNRDTGGTGLGLPIARQIAEMAGGTLAIKDSPHGARFVLCLPQAPPEGTSRAPAS